MLLKIPFFKQKKDYTCGPASVQMILAFFNKFESQKKLMKEAKTIPDTGTTHKNMINLALREGFYCYVHDNAHIKEISEFIKNNLPVIVNFIEPSDNDPHYAVVSGIKGKNIIFNDPWNGKNFKMTLTEFQKRWYYYYEKHKYSRWIMVLSKEKLKLKKLKGKIYLPKKL